MQTKIQKWGNSLGLRIPKLIAEEAGVYAGSEVELSLEDGDLIVRPVRQPRYDLEQLLEKVTDENLHDEFDWGTSVGRESW
jgi:antitoxin MazE